MKENTFGYRWKARDGMNPALLSATALNRARGTQGYQDTACLLDTLNTRP